MEVFPEWIAHLLHGVTSAAVGLGLGLGLGLWLGLGLEWIAHPLHGASLPYPYP